ncbi:MAG: HAD hydrolase-like protein, partial [Candidatus Marinimicrobia bacterium]|nr:HAD hydrolase-like protein [Candidatus Neomarinimicrobiota bacterium]
MCIKLKGIIFDFDGVIADSVQVKTDAFASLYEQYGDNIVTKVIEHHEANGGMSRFKKIKLYHES